MGDMIQLDLKVGATWRVHCNYCRVVTNHELKCSHRSQVDWFRMDTGEIDYESYIEDEPLYIEARLWFCRGCDTCFMEAVYNQGDPFPLKAETFPPRQMLLVAYKEYMKLPRPLEATYREVIKSFNHDLLILCTVGLRALLEGICVDKQVYGKSLYQRIEGLRQFLPDNIVDSLHTFRFMGNEAVHELKAPSKYGLKQCIDVIEDLLNFLYELDYKVRRLPKRSAKSK